MRLIGSRWFEPMDTMSHQDTMALKAMTTWIETGTSREDFKFSMEEFFPVQHPDGRYGVMYEAELEDGFTPTPEQIEAVKLCVVAPGEFQYVDPGDCTKTWHGCAAYWVFFPGRFFNIAALEATARQISKEIS